MKQLLIILLLCLSSCLTTKQTCEKETKKCCTKKIK